MSDFTIAVYTYSTGVPVLVPSGLTVAPSNWSAVAKGGMWDAEIMLYGPLDDLAGLTAWLGDEVKIINQNGTEVWWGDIVTVEIVSGGLRKGISLDRMANRVTLRYAKRKAGGGAESTDTAWTENTLSQASYGIWERRIMPERELTTGEATAMQATALTTLSAPHYTLSLDSGQEAARLYCTGYWQRGKRFYYTNLAGLETHNASGTAYPLGLGLTSSSIAFSNRAKSIAQLNGYFSTMDSDYKVKVTGSASNNTTFTVTGTDDRPAVVYSSTGIVFAANDDIHDNNGGLGFIQNDDLFHITGSVVSSGSNNGTHIMDKAGASNAEVGSFHAAVIVNESAGPTINFYRGNAITVTPTPTNEPMSASVTATVWGQRYYQTFTLSANAGSWTVDTIEIRLCRIGGPADSVQVQLYTDNAGSPNTLLKSATVAADNIPLEMDWVAFDFDNAQSLAYGTTYGLVVSRTGANDWDDYYQVDLDDGATYAGGTCKAYDGAAYQTLSPSADLIFRVMGGTDTGTQISQLLTNSWAQNVATVTTSVTASQYRNGEARAFDELETLLDTGASDGTRLIATTTSAKGVIIATKPNAITARWAWQDSNRLTDLYGQDAELGYLPAGEWVKLGDASSLGPWSALSPVFVERAEYSAGSGWSLEPEGAADPFDTGTVQG